MTIEGATEIRAVLDTNILASAFTNPDGPTFRIWEAAIEGRFVALTSPALLKELAEVMRRVFGRTEEDVQRIVRLIAREAAIVRPLKTLRVVAADPDDDRVLECAVEGRAGVVVSNDRHLPKLGEYAGIVVMAGPDFRRMLGLREGQPPRGRGRPRGA